MPSTKLTFLISACLISIFNASIAFAHDITFSLPNPIITNPSYTPNGHILPILTPKQIAELRENLAETQLSPPSSELEPNFSAPTVSPSSTSINPEANINAHTNNDEFIKSLYTNPGSHWAEAKLKTAFPSEIHYWLSPNKRQAILRLNSGNLVIPKIAMHISNPVNNTNVYKFNYTPRLLWVSDKNNKIYEVYINAPTLAAGKKKPPLLHLKKTNAICEVSIGNRIVSIC